MSDLWSKWSEHYERNGIDPLRICRDGILDEKKYAAAEKKVLFILKEVNDFAGGDLSEHLKEGPRYQMWYNVARWAYGLLYDFPDFEEADAWSSKLKALAQVAAINLKKASGTASSDMSVINAYAFRDRELLLDQIAYIAPQVIVSCGVNDSLVWLFELNIDPDHPHRPCQMVTPCKAQFIPWRHPARAAASAYYDNLRNAVLTPPPPQS